MRRGRSLLIIGIVLLLLIWLGGLGYWYFVMRPASAGGGGAGDATPAPVVEQTDVVVVSQPVPRGTILTEELLSTVPTPKDLFMPNMFSDLGAVVNRQLKFDLEAGTPVLATMLVDPGEQIQQGGSVASLSIPRGMVAVSIPVNALSSISYAPRPGDHVNVIVTMDFVDLDPEFQSVLPNLDSDVQAQGCPTCEAGRPPVVAAVTGGIEGRAEIDPVLGQTMYVYPNGAQVRRYASQTLLQDVVILQIGDFPLPGAEAQPEEAPAEEDEEAPEIVPPARMTLIISPQDAVTLNYLLNAGGTLSLALRSSGDDTRVATEAITLQFLLDQYRIPIPVKLPYGANIPNLPGAAPAEQGTTP